MNLRDSRSYASESAENKRLLVLRIWITAAVVLGVNYVVWRWFASVNWSAWWIAVPLVLAETYSVIDLGLFGMTVWRSRQRGEPPEALVGATADVFITTYNEPVEMVLNTAAAANGISYPHQTWILDDGDRVELRAAAADLGVGYITRGQEWAGKPRHAKAGNLNNALLETTGEYILILDADMVPEPQILDRTLGYFADDLVALVQTPQYFNNVPASDPLGSQAPLFYGPIQEGKDGWGAAFFCGSNAVLRREALMQLGILGYVTATEAAVINRLKEARRVVRRAASKATDETSRFALAETLRAIGVALTQIGNGEPIGEATYLVQSRINSLSRDVVAKDLAGIALDLDSLELDDDSRGAGGNTDELVAHLSGAQHSPMNELEAVQRTVLAIDVGRSDEAQALLPMATISVTEDMATAMRLHASGWKSVYHNEILVEGLAPEGLDASLTQRLRWAQGTVQVMLKENPLFVRGLSLPQRLMYFSTMWSYLSGFANVIYLAAPIIFLTAGILPVNSYAAPFFLRFLPFMIVNQLLFLVASRGLPTWRGQQYTLALFPVWIKACVSAAANVFGGVPLNFAVTPKSGTHAERIQLGTIKWQILAAAALVIAAIVGLVRLVVLHAEPLGTLVNVGWVVYDLVAMSVLVGAVRYRGYQTEKELS
ncbi:MAG TPA: glycosyltransferase family 2 protein [Propionicimonas sp.]|uniref:glycosyltransferase family 2 protein n=1 Tax=Propionicimonas sp. TaxID=1955623 RepID=UPI002F429F1D